MRWQQQADAEHTILLSALHDIAGLDEDRLVAGVLDLELVDLTGLADGDDFLRQRLLQGERHRSAARGAMHEVNRKISKRHRIGQAVRATVFGMDRGNADETPAEREENQDI